jgi:hypothetical protein
MGPTLEPTEPGDFTREFTFAIPKDGDFRIGEHTSSMLTWPRGDQSPVHRWRLIMTVIAMKTGKEPLKSPVDLCVRWTPEKNSLEFMEFRDSIPPASF